MKKYTLVLFVLITPILLFGQTKELKFEKTTHDFGTIKEEAGLVAHVFEFINTGKIPIIIKSVNASCGCTTPAWTKEPVLPGKKGSIKVTFNPANRPNKFVKSINVTTNVGAAKLLIKGNVTPKPKTLAELYPKKVEQLRLKTSYVMFNEIGNGKAGKLVVEAVNDSEDDIEVKFGNTPEYINITIDKKNLKPKEKAEIEVVYNANKANFWGFHSDIVPIYVNGVSKSSHSLVVTATVIEDFSKLTKEELENAPVIGVDKLKANFNSVLAGDIVKTQFKITNIGRSPLILREIDSSSDSVEVDVKNRFIEPNTQEIINVTFTTDDKKGYQNHQITIITNSPDLPVLNLKISGMVE